MIFSSILKKPLNKNNLFLLNISKKISTKTSLKNLYNKFLGFLIKKGNKIKAKFIIDKAFILASIKTKKSLCFLIFKIFSSLNIFVEAKTIRVKRSSHVVPFPVTLKRRSYLITKWFMSAVLQNKKKISISEKIAQEIVTILKTSNSTAIKIKNNNNKQSILNRSNIHYRW